MDSLCGLNQRAISAVPTGRTHDLHPTASRKAKERFDPGVPSKRDPFQHLRGKITPYCTTRPSTGSAPEWEHLVEAFRQGLRETELRRRQSVAIQYRWADGQSARLPALASDLVARRVSVIAVAGGTAAVLAAKRATKSIPIVFAVGGDRSTQGWSQA
jgi:hypothetical protein